MSNQPTLVPASNVSGALWLNDRMEQPWREDHSVRVSGIIAAGFEAYARVFHPAAEAGTNRPVRWADVAVRFGCRPHGEMQWHAIMKSRTSYDPRPNLFRDPERGRLPLPETRVLVELLGDETRTPNDCWFAVWEGWGTPVPLRPRGSQPGMGIAKWFERWPFDRAPRFERPGRNYYLLRGPIEAASPRASWQGASLWWPSDRAWCVATEVDYMWSYVGGTRRCIDRILADDRLESWSASLDDRADVHGDQVNRLM